MTTLIVDGNNLAYRCRYTFFLTNGEEDVSVVYGFLYVLNSVIGKFHPSSVVVCWDSGVPEARKALYKDYKAGRHKGETKEQRQEFYAQMDTLRRALPAMGVVCVSRKGVEADDLMYWASREIQDECVIITSDYDMLQAVTPNQRVTLYSPTRDLQIGWETFQGSLGIRPEQFLDYRVMLGDSSDNIKGIQGIGEKYAVQILDTFGTLNNALRAATIMELWPLAARVKKCLAAVTNEQVSNIRQLIDLSVDRYGSAEAVQRAVQASISYDHRTVKLFLMSKGFISLLGGKMRQTYGELKVPPLKTAECRQQIRLTIVRL